MSNPYSGALASQAPPRRRYVGLDLSLTNTGIVTIDEDGAQYVRTVSSKGTKTATLTERATRLRGLANEIILTAATADIVCVEAPAYNSTGGSHHDRSGLWWIIVDALTDLEVELLEIAPATVKKYSTGKGNAAKDVVLASVIRRYPDTAVFSNDEADAFVLAAIAARLDGHPIETGLPQTHLDALKAVTR